MTGGAGRGGSRRWRVAIIGPGRVGTLLAVALSRAGHRVVAVGGGSEAARAGIADLVAGTRTTPEVSEAAADADLVLLTTPDDVIGEVVTTLARDGALGEGHHVVHVAGSRGLDVLRRAALTGARVAACHPAMTVPQGATDPDLLVGVPWAVTAAQGDLDWARSLVGDLGGDPHVVPDDARVLYHAGLAVGSNAVGAAVVVARQLLTAARIADPATFLGPLVERSAANALAGGAATLTGPVVRGDAGTVARHLAALDADVPELADAYRQLTRVLLGRVRASLSPQAAAELDALLDAPDAPFRGSDAPRRGPDTL